MPKTTIKLYQALIGETKNSTVSALYHEGKHICFIIEDGYREIKEAGETRIDGQVYTVIKRYDGRFFKSYSERFGHKHAWIFLNVRGFTGIMTHIGCTILDTRGCTLPNEGFRFDGENYVGISSTNAYKKFYELTKDFDQIEWTIDRTPVRTQQENVI